MELRHAENEERDDAQMKDESCRLCGEDMKDLSMFDCGHAVCFTCTTNMLKARDVDASFVMSCCFSVEGCKGQLAVMPNKSRVESMLSDTEDGSEEWRRYMACAENVMLRASGMFPCTSATCRAQDLLFVPDAEVSNHTQCGSCGVFICTMCTHAAGKCVPSHAPLPCARRVELEDSILTLKSRIQEAERAVRREAAQRMRDREMQRHDDQDMLHFGRQGGSHPVIEQEIVDAVGKGQRETSAAEIFAAIDAAVSAAKSAEKDAADASAAARKIAEANKTTSSASISSEKAASTTETTSTTEAQNGRPSTRRILSPMATGRWCRALIANHNLPISIPTLQECIALLQRHDRKKEVGILEEIQAGTYKVRFSNFEDSILRNPNISYISICPLTELDGWIFRIP